MTTATGTTAKVPVVREVPPSGLAAGAVEVAAIAGRRLRRLRRAPARVMGVALSPLVSLFMLGYLLRDAIAVPAGGGYLDYLFAGTAVQVALAGIGPTAIAVALDLREGLVDRFRSLPIARSAFLLGHTIGDLLVGLLALVIVTAVGLGLGWRSQTGLLPTLAGFGLITVFILVMLWVGVLFAVSMKNIESISAVTPFLVIVLPFLSNAYVAPGDVPAPLRAVAEWNPLSALITVCRRLWGNPAAAGSSGFAGDHPVLVLTLSLSLLSVVAVGLSLRRFRLAV